MTCEEARAVIEKHKHPSEATRAERTAVNNHVCTCAKCGLGGLTLNEQIATLVGALALGVVTPEGLERAAILSIQDHTDPEV